MKSQSTSSGTITKFKVQYRLNPVPKPTNVTPKKKKRK